MSNDESEWGPRITHDGSGCPCVGHLVVICFRDGEQWEIVAGEGAKAVGVSVNSYLSPWVWTSLHSSDADIIRYRIRKPKGLVILEKLLQDLPTKVDQEVYA